MNSQETKYMVCKAHLNTKEEEMPTYAYPGNDKLSVFLLWTSFNNFEPL